MAASSRGSVEELFACMPHSLYASRLDILSMLG
jgi:hypothetical protein